MIISNNIGTKDRFGGWYDVDLLFTECGGPYAMSSIPYSKEVI